LLLRNTGNALPVSPATRLLLVPIGVGVGIGIGIDSDGYCGWSSRTVQPRYLSFVSIVQKR
jgi:hypothetical protein